MSSPAAEVRSEPCHPRETAALFGHSGAEQAFLEAYRGRRLAHAWLIGGPPGIGKATLAYRIARFVLAHPDPECPEVRSASSLALATEHPVARRVAAQAHGNLLTLERAVNEKTGKLRQDISVDNVRRTVSFFGSTAGEGGWRVAIVDAVDELNPSGANALLKILEEPPSRALLLLVNHSSARVLPTIRSRCRALSLCGLEVADLIRAGAAASGRAADDPELTTAAGLADGSVARLLTLLDADQLSLRQSIVQLLDRLPAVDPRALHTLGERLGTADQARLFAFIDTVNGWLSARLTGGSQEPWRLVRLAEAWEKVNRAARDSDIYNLERKPLVFSVFGWLAEAARG